MQKAQRKQQVAKKTAAPKKAVAKKTKRTLKTAKRSNCTNDPKKAGVRLGQSTLSAKFPEVSGNMVLPGSLEITKFSTQENLSKGLAVLFSYPLDFTFVCPTELNEMSENIETFKQMGVSVYGVSTDSAQAHQTWMRMPVKQGGIEGLKFPLVSDTSRDITFAMGALLPTGFATRSTYVLLDGVIQHAQFNTPGVGRSAQDLIRTVQAIKHHNEVGEVCVAGPKVKSIAATREGLLDFLNKEAV